MMRFHNRITVLALMTGIVTGAAGCDSTNPRVATTLNRDAALAGGLPSNPLQGRVITSWIDKSDKQHPIMSTLFGNEIAVKYARSKAGHAYPAGSVLSVVTWNQQEDPRWFGGSIPASTRSVEYVTVAETPDHKPAYAYAEYAGSPLTKASEQTAPVPAGRAALILSERAAVMP